MLTCLLFLQIGNTLQICRQVNSKYNMGVALGGVMAMVCWEVTDFFSRDITWKIYLVLRNAPKLEWIDYNR